MGARRNPKAKSASDEPGVRLQKLIADAGLASRRTAERWIVAGRVSVNGRVVTELGARAGSRDRVEVDGRRLRGSRPARHYVVYKPRGVITTTRDPNAKRTVMDLVRTRERLFPVGRLDAASEGLLLLTNDGALAQVLSHPRYQIPRTYKVSVDGKVQAESLRTLAGGIEIDGRRTAPCEVRVLEQAEDRSVLEIQLVEGRRRQIRSMMDAVGHPVRRLLRVRYGPLSLRGLRSGDSRPLDANEREALARIAREAGTPTPAQPRRSPAAGARAKPRRKRGR